jgi:hypothetical protein
LRNLQTVGGSPEAAVIRHGREIENLAQGDSIEFGHG